MYFGLSAIDKSIDGLMLQIKSVVGRYRKFISFDSLNRLILDFLSHFFFLLYVKSSIYTYKRILNTEREHSLMLFIA